MSRKTRVSMLTKLPILCPKCNSETSRQGYSLNKNNIVHQCLQCYVKFTTDIYGNRIKKEGRPKKDKNSSSRQKFRELRSSKITYKKMAELLNVSLATLYNWKKQDDKEGLKKLLGRPTRVKMFSIDPVVCPRCDRKIRRSGYGYTKKNIKHLCNECSHTLTTNTYGETKGRGGRPRGSGDKSTYDFQDEARQRFRKLKEQGMPYKKIAKILHVSISTLSRWASSDKEHLNKSIKEQLTKVFY